MKFIKKFNINESKLSRSSYMGTVGRGFISKVEGMEDEIQSIEDNILELEDEGYNVQFTQDGYKRYIVPGEEYPQTVLEISISIPVKNRSQRNPSEIGWLEDLSPAIVSGNDGFDALLTIYENNIKLVKRVQALVKKMERRGWEIDMSCSGLGKILIHIWLKSQKPA